MATITQTRLYASPSGNIEKHFKFTFTFTFCFDGFMKKDNLVKII